MVEKTQITVYGKTYNVKSGLSSADPQGLADYVDHQMHELSRGQSKPSTIDLAILTALNIAGELFELREEVQRQQKESHSDQQEASQKARKLVQLVEKELKEIQNSRGSRSAS